VRAIKRRNLNWLPALLVAGLLLAHVSLSRMDLQRLVACAATNNASRTPSPVCRFYLEHVADSEDAAQLAAGPGLAYTFGIDDQPTRRAVMERLLELGVDINAPAGTDGLTPLNAAILLNDAELAGFLLARGADPQARDAHGHNADDYLDLLREQDGMTDRSALSTVIGRDTAQP